MTSINIPNSSVLTAQSPLGYDFLNPTAIHPASPDPPLLHPPTTQRTFQEVNLSVLRRYLPGTESVVLVTPYAALYEFYPSVMHWEKSSIQGTLFLVSLEAPSPGLHRYAIIILNRLSLDNFIFELMPSADVDLEEEIIVMRADDADDSVIWGIWLFEEGEGSSTAGIRNKVTRKIRECIDTVQAEAEPVGDSMALGEGDEYSYEDLYGSSDAHVSPIESPLQRLQAEQFPMSRSDPSSTLPPVEPSEKRPPRGNLEALLHRAMQNYLSAS